MSDVLGRIVESTRQRLGREAPQLEESRRRAADRKPGRKSFRFSAALRRRDWRDPLRVIAEIKSASPSAGSIVENPAVEMIAQQYREGGASAISVVTEQEFFLGSPGWLERAATVQLPVLMKDFILEERQIVEGVAAGAEAVLLLASLLDAKQISDALVTLDDLGCDALVEVHDEAELDRVLSAGARVVGVNNRNLRDFTVDLRTSERLARSMPAGLIKVSESGVRTADDMRRLRDAGFDAVLVGESLLRQEDRSAGVKELIEWSRG